MERSPFGARAARRLRLGQQPLRDVEQIRAWHVDDTGDVDRSFADAVAHAAGLEELAIAVLAQAYLARGESDRAADLVRRGMSTVVSSHHPRGRMFWLTSNGILARHERRWDDAELSLEQALTLARKSLDPHQEGQIIAEWGAVFLYRGDVAGAESRLDEAGRIFLQLGERPNIDLTNRLPSTLRSPQHQR